MVWYSYIELALEVECLQKVSFDFIAAICQKRFDKVNPKAARNPWKSKYITESVERNNILGKNTVSIVVDMSSLRFP